MKKSGFFFLLLFLLVPFAKAEEKTVIMKEIKPIKERNASIGGISDDGMSVAYWTKKGNGQAVFINDKQVSESFNYVWAVAISADGTKAAYGANNGSMSAIFLNNRRISDWFDKAWGVSLNSDGTKVAYSVKQNNKGAVFINDKQISDWFDYDEINSSETSLSSDGTKVAYNAKKGNKQAIFINDGRISEWFDKAWGVSLNSDGTKVAYIAKKSDKQAVFINDKQISGWFFNVWGLSLSLDGAKVAYGANNHDISVPRSGNRVYNNSVFINDRLVSEWFFRPSFDSAHIIALSPDGARVAYSRYHEKKNRNFINEKETEEGVVNARLFRAKGIHIIATGNSDLIRVVKIIANASNMLGENTISDTINFELQKTAEKALGKQNGIIVVLDVKTGEVLSAVSHLKNNDRSKSDGKIEAYLKDAMNVRYHPGSIWKILDAFLLLKNKDVGYNCVGNEEYEGVSTSCVLKHHELSGIEEAFYKSCNNYFFKRGLAEILIADFASTSKLFTSCDLKIASNKDYADSLLGEKITLSPMEGAVLAATIASGGIKHEPPDAKDPNKGQRVMSVEVAERLQGFMRRVVTDGTARNLGDLAKGKYLVGAKTGSAPKKADSGKEEMIVWMIGFAGKEKPEIAFAVVIEDAQGYAGVVCSPIVDKIARAAFQKQR